MGAMATGWARVFGIVLGLAVSSPSHAEAGLSPDAIAKVVGVDAKLQPDGVVRVTWPRTDVHVEVDGVRLAPAAGLSSWAAFAPMGDDAMLMGDTVVFEDEVDAAMDAAFVAGLQVTALHNHFFYDQPKVFFMHIAGHGPAAQLASGVRAVWDAIKSVRNRSGKPAQAFGGPPVTQGPLDTNAIAKIAGHPAPSTSGVAKVTIGREGTMHTHAVGTSMGLSTWAAFTGSDEAAAIDGDFIMAAEEVQPVLKALRANGLHVVALHNHMIGEAPAYYFTHVWGRGKASELARGFRKALDAQAESAAP